MKVELKNIALPIGFGVLALALNSCSLLGKGKYASQWEIKSDVPASLSSGRAATPSATAGTQVKSNLDGLAPVVTEPLDLPGSESGTLSDIPKPEGMGMALAMQSPPEMLNIPSASEAGELPYTSGTPSGLQTLLPAPPPMVTEEELNLAPAALAAVPEVTPPPVNPIPTPDPVPAASETIPSIPLLYGKLDLAPFLNPPTPLAANTPPTPAAH